MHEFDRPPTLLDPEYVAGLIDSSGEFTVSVKNRENAIDYFIDPVIRISVPTGGYLLQHLEQFFDEYNISHNKYSQSDSSYRKNVLINNKDDIKTVGEAVGPYLIGQRDSATKLIKDVIPRYEADLHQSKQVFYDTMAIADELRDTPTENLELTQDYFAELWEDELALEGPEQDDG